MRGVPRWLAVLAVLAIVAVVGAFTLHRALTPATLILEASPAALPADGFTSTELKLHSTRAGICAVCTSKSTIPIALSWIRWPYAETPRSSLCAQEFFRANPNSISPPQESNRA